MDTTKTKQTQQIANNELIVYQLGEVKGLLTTMSAKFDQYKSDTDKRLNELEQFKAGQAIQDAVAPKPLDAQKIILALISLVSSIAAIALGFYQFH